MNKYSQCVFETITSETHGRDCLLHIVCTPHTVSREHLHIHKDRRGKKHYISPPQYNNYKNEKQQQDAFQSFLRTPSKHPLKMNNISSLQNNHTLCFHLPTCSLDHCSGSNIKLVVLHCYLAASCFLFSLTVWWKKLETTRKSWSLND